MHSHISELIGRCCVTLATSLVLISISGMRATNAAESFTPTMQDMLSIQGAIERYLKGMDTRDVTLQATAFWDDAVIISPQGPDGPQVKKSVKETLVPLEMPPQVAGGSTAAAAPPPTCDSKAQMPATGWSLWHLVANSSYEFLSPTRVKHHAYWFTVCPSAGPANGAGLAVIGPPGSYNDILEKRNGEWRFIERNIVLNQKYAGS